MVTKHLKFRKNLISFVFRYRYEKPDNLSKFIWDKDDWRFGAWYKKQQSRSNTNRNKIINDYMIGVEFFIFKTWIKIIKDYYA